MKYFVVSYTVLLLLLMSSCTEKYAPDGALYYSFLEEKHEPYWDINIRQLWMPREKKYRVCMYFEGTPYSGKVLQIYGNGYPQFKGQYLEGKRHGKWYYYYDNGQPQKILEYHKNRLRNKKEFEQESYDDDF